MNALYAPSLRGRVALAVALTLGTGGLLAGAPPEQSTQPAAQARLATPPDAAASLPPRPVPGPFSERALPPRRVATLDNGTRVVVERHAAVPVVWAALLAGAPSAGVDRAQLTVLAGLISRRLRGPSALSAAADAAGASITATADERGLTLTGRAPARSLEALLAALANASAEFSADEDALAAETAHAAQLATRAQAVPWTRAEQEVQRLLFGARAVVNGTGAPGLAPESLRAAHARAVAPKELTLLLVGDIDPEAALEATRRRFGGRPGSRGVVTPVDEPATAGATERPPVVFVDRPGAALVTIAMAAAGPAPAELRSAAFDVLNAVFGGSTNSRLFRRLVQEEGWSYGPLSQVRTLGGRSYLLARADTRNDAAAAVAREMLGLLDGLAREPVPAAELADAAGYLRGQLLLQGATAAARVQQFGAAYRAGLDVVRLDGQDRRLAAVTAADVQALAAEVLAPSRRVVVVVGDRAKVGADLAFLGEATSAAPPAGASAIASPPPPLTPDQLDEREFGAGPMLEVARLARGGDPEALERAVLALRGKVPFVESDPRTPGRSVVTFLHLAAPDVHLVTLPQFRSGSVPLAQDANSPRPPSRSQPVAFRRLWGSRVWYLRLNLPDTTLLGYTIGVERLPRPGADPREARGDEMLDPLNPERLGTRGDVSILRLPRAPEQRWIVERAEVPKGRLEPGTLESRALGATRAVTVYLPPGYDRLREPARLVFVFDGDWFSKDLRAPTVLDNLHDERRIPPTVAVFVDAGDTRDRDLVNHDPFAEFMANELLPWVVERYRVSRVPGHVALSGASFGGLAATFIALRHPDRFGNVLSQSGAFWPPPGWNPMTPYGPGADRDSALIEEFVRAPRAPVRFYLDTGLYEPAMLDGNRRLRDVLLAKGYRLTYVEQPGTHNGVYWRNSLGDGLVALFGAGESAP